MFRAIGWWCGYLAIVLLFFSADAAPTQAQAQDIIVQRGRGLGIETIGAFGKMPILAIEKILHEEALEMKDFPRDMRLKDFLQMLHEKLRRRGKTIGFAVDEKAFPVEAIDDLRVLDLEVRLPDRPRRLGVATVLSLLMSQIPTKDATLRIHRGLIEITTLNRLSDVLDVPIACKFEKLPLAKVLDELTEGSGVSIVVDCRVEEKTKTKVTAKFVRGATMQTALDVLTDMADLRYVVVGNVVYVTSPENAQRLEREAAKRKQGEVERK